MAWIDIPINLDHLCLSLSLLLCLLSALSLALISVASAPPCLSSLHLFFHRDRLSSFSFLQWPPSMYSSLSISFFTLLLCLFALPCPVWLFIVFRIMSFFLTTGSTVTNRVFFHTPTYSQDLHITTHSKVWLSICALQSTHAYTPWQAEK